MARPRLSHALVSCSLLVAVSAVVFPLSLLAAVLGYVKYTVSSFRTRTHLESKRKRTALINGGRMQKSIFVARALKQKGYRVIVVEEKGWGELCAARFSLSVDLFLLVPGGGGKHYIDAMVQLGLREKVDFFAPCSGAGTTIEDAKIAAVIFERSNGATQSLIQEPALVEVLHEKVSEDAL